MTFIVLVHVEVVCSSWCCVVLHFTNILQFISLPINIHLGYLGAIMKKSVMNILIQVFEQMFSFIFNKHVDMELLDYMVGIY